jgi:hypothetical protein
MLRLPIYYLIVVFGMYFFQDFFIYYPEKSDAEIIVGPLSRMSLGGVK